MARNRCARSRADRWLGHARGAVNSSRGRLVAQLAPEALELVVGAGRHGDNVVWISFPSGVEHVFCYAYYVKPLSGHPGTAVASPIERWRGAAPRGTLLVEIQR